MKVAFVYSKNQFNDKLFQILKERLSKHELLLWEAKEEAPANDIEVALVVGAFTHEQMAGQPKLKFIQTLSAGYELIDVDAASEMGIWVSYSPSELTGNAISVAEFAVLLLLGVSRHLNQIFQRQQKQPDAVPATPVALNGKTVCIIGLGAIGRLLADRLKPFGVHINATDDHPREVPDGVKVFKTDQMTEAIASADYVVICVRAAKDNENLVNAGFLKAMKQGSVLVNVARGSLVDEAALFDAVKSGHLAGAGLDVMRKEPVNPQHPLLTLPQVIITPHAAGVTDLTFNGSGDYASQVIEEIAAGKKPGALVNDPAKPR